MKLISLNIEGRKHWDLIEPFLEKEHADVICFQEIFESDAARLAEKFALSFKFVPLTLMRSDMSDEASPYEAWGIAMMSRAPLKNVRVLKYHDSASDLLRYDSMSYQARHATIRQDVLIADIENNGAVFTVATTHFPVTLHGIFDELQQADINVLLKVLSDIPDVILCGDFNAPRGFNKVYDLLAEKYEDAIPKAYASSLDLNIHRAKNNPAEAERVARYMVDYLFLSKKYVASDVRLQSGVSDHCAIVAELSVK